MSRLALQEYLNDRIKNVKYYIEFNERKTDKDFFAHKELELYQMAEKYMQLTNELGCPLDVVFKALKEGYQYKLITTNIITKKEIKQIIKTDYAYLSYSDDCWWIATIKDAHRLSDYKKTWFLKGDLSE